jgi:hypothetical protein
MDQVRGQWSSAVAAVAWAGLVAAALTASAAPARGQVLDYRPINPDRHIWSLDTPDTKGETASRNFKGLWYVWLGGAVLATVVVFVSMAVCLYSRFASGPNMRKAAANDPWLRRRMQESHAAGSDDLAILQGLPANAEASNAGPPPEAWGKG